MTVWIAQMALRSGIGLALILGILDWTGRAGDSLVLVHMILGILVVFSLWTLGVAQALRKGGSWGLATSAVIFGLILAASGGTQEELLTGSWHWVIQGIHVLLGLSALVLGEWIGRHSQPHRPPAAA